VYFLFVLLFASFAFSQDCDNLGGPACCALPYADTFGSDLAAGKTACSKFKHVPCVNAGKYSTFCICLNVVGGYSRYEVHGTCEASPPPPPPPPEPSSSSASPPEPPPIEPSSSSASFPPELPSSDSGGGSGGNSSDSGGGGSNIALTPETIDSVIVVFNDGYLTAVYMFLPAVIGAFAILLCVYLLNCVVSKF